MFWESLHYHFKDLLQQLSRYNSELTRLESCYNKRFDITLPKEVDKEINISPNILVIKDYRRQTRNIQRKLYSFISNNDNLQKIYTQLEDEGQALLEQIRQHD